MRDRNRPVKRLGELSCPHKAALLLVIAAQLGLLVSAELDLHRRSAAELRGSKAVWRLVCLINFVGPLGYFRCGRRQP